MPSEHNDLLLMQCTGCGDVVGCDPAHFKPNKTMSSCCDVMRVQLNLERKG